MLTNGCIIFGQKIDPSFSFVLKFLLVHDSYLTEVYVYIFYRRSFQPQCHLLRYQMWSPVANSLI